MTTTKSSFSTARMLPVYKNILRRNRGTGLFSFVLGFLFLPLQYLLIIIKNYNLEDMDWLRWEFIGVAGVYNGVSA